MVDRGWDEHRTERRPAEPDRPWASGPVERVNRTLSGATAKRHGRNHGHCEKHRNALPRAYNFAKRSGTLHGPTPRGLVCAGRHKEPPALDETCTSTSRD